MNIQLHEALTIFHNRMKGEKVRGQIVDHVELMLTTNGDELKPFLVVVFRENPTKGTDSERIIQAVFSEIPPDATIACETVDEARARMVGLKPNHEHEWRLTDEIPEAKA